MDGGNYEPVTSRHVNWMTAGFSDIRSQRRPNFGGNSLLGGGHHAPKIAVPVRQEDNGANSSDSEDFEYIKSPRKSPRKK